MMAWASNSSVGDPSPSFKPGVTVLNALSSSTPITSGVEVRSGEAVIRIVALRDDVLRVRIAQNGKFSEDASWAVLPEAIKQLVNVISQSTEHTVSFRTQALRVDIERATMRMRVSDLEGNVLQEDSEGMSPEFRQNSFRIYKRMPDDEHYFGLGDKVGPLDRRGQSFTLWNTDAYKFQESTDPIYKSIPFFIAVRQGRAMGVLLDNTWRSSFDFGRQVPGTYSFGAENGAVDYYLLYGSDAKQVVKSYAWLTGTTPLPPLWALGFQQSRFTYEPASRLREVAAKLRADRIPTDTLYLDIGFQQDNKPFTVDTSKFANFTQLVDDLKKQNFHLIVITDLHIAQQSDYSPYDSGIAGDHFLKNPDGSNYVGKVWPGRSVFPDFTRSVTRDWWGSLYKDFVAEGVAGFWNDMNEPSVFDGPGGTMPDSVRHRIEEPGFETRVAGHREIHNVYGMQNSRATYEGLLKLEPELRPFVLTRATFAGGQRYASTWTGDNSSTWNHLRLSNPMLLNLGVSGFGMSGADVGGFIGTPQPDLLTKWIELAAFQPIDRDHAEKGTGDKEPWVHGPGHENIRRAYIEERYRLMPYLYTTAEEMSRTGLPIVRPLFLEFPKATADAHPLDLDAGNEFLFGHDLLVAPSPYPEKLDDYSVKLPPVGWYDYWTGERYAFNRQATPEVESPNTPADPTAGLTSINVHPRLEVLPVYVREGAILPVQPLTQSTEEKPKGPLTLRVYPGRDCSGAIYQDDGKTMAYKRGESLRMQLSCEVTGNSVKLHVGSHEGSYKPWWSQLRIEVYGWQSRVARVIATGAATAPKASVDVAHHFATFTIPDEGNGADIEITQ